MVLAAHDGFAPTTSVVYKPVVFTDTLVSACRVYPVPPWTPPSAGTSHWSRYVGDGRVRLPPRTRRRVRTRRDQTHLQRVHIVQADSCFVISNW